MSANTNDTNYYPLSFTSFSVTSTDASGNPLITIFYKEPEFTTETFRWVKTFDANDNIATWKIVIA